MTTKKILVTGGAGYIGSHTVVELLNAGYQPVIFDNFSNSQRWMPWRIGRLTKASFPVYEADISNKEALREVFEREQHIAGVIHFAAHKYVGESTKNPLKYYRTNVEGTQNLVEVMEEFGVSNLVFSSSCTVYGNNAQMPANEEASMGKAASPYGHTKQLCERLLTNEAEQGKNLRSAMLRYFNPIGAHPSGLIGELPIGRPENIMPLLMEAAMGKREKLTVFGKNYPTPDGTCVRDYIHVCDLAAAHVQALSWLEAHPAVSLAEAFNIGTGRGSSVLDLICAFTDATGVDIPWEMGAPRKGDLPEMYAHTQKANQQLGWKARKTMEQAMADAWRWQQTQVLNKAFTSAA